MRAILKGLSILLGLFTGYLAIVAIAGLVMTPFGIGAGPLTMRIGAYGVTSESVSGYLVCAVVTFALTSMTWVFISLIPRKICPKAPPGLLYDEK